MNRMTLRELGIGESGCVVEVGGEKILRHRLLEMGITPRTVITVKKAAPMGDPLELFLRGYTLSLRLEDAERIIVEEIGSGCGTNAACKSCKTKKSKDRRRN